MIPEVFRMLFYSLNGRAPEDSPTTRADFDIKPLRSPKKENFLKQELIELIEESVFKELSNKEEVWLSLSAGYDATSIMGACLAKGLKPKCFSYGKTDPPPHSDVFVARKMAEIAGLHHEIWPMDKYPVQEVQLANARMFDQRANRCGELGAWLYFQKEIAPKLSEEPLFVFGDECFGWSNCRLRNTADVLLAIGIQPDASQIEHLISQNKYMEFKAWYKERTETIFAKAAHLESLHDKKDYLYFHERLQMVIKPWRKNYAGRYGQFCAPLISREILSFVGALPLPLRLGKKLMRAATQERYADLFKIKRARTSGAPPLSQICSWPPQTSIGNIKSVADKFSIREQVIDLFNHTPQASLAASPQGQKLGGLKNLLKGSLFMGFYQISRSFIPPVFNISRELILSRIQIWLLRELLKA